MLDFLQFQKSDHRVKTLVDKYNPKKSSFKMEKWGEHYGLWSLIMNGKKSKSKKFIYNFIFQVTSAQPSVDQSLGGEKQTKKLLDYGEIFT